MSTLPTPNPAPVAKTNNPTLTPAQAARQLLLLKEAEDSFLGFVKALFPKYELQHFQLHIIDVLDKLEKGLLTNADGHPVYKVMINLPPRHGKSWLATTLFPVYYLARKPTRHVMSVSYNTELAKTFGREVKRLTQEPIAKQVFPDFAIKKDTSAVDHWMTEQGGNYFNISMDGTTSGRPANLLIIDDPVKNRSDADSPTIRNKVWSDYVSSVAIRKQPDEDGCPAIEVVILTRWHPDDLAGRIMAGDEWANGEWVHINYPAITKEKSGALIPRHMLDPSHPEYEARTGKIKYTRAEREVALWEARFPLSELIKRRSRDAREFEALYQQNPYVAGGNLIKERWWRYRSPEDKGDYVALVIGADTAFKAKEQADYSVFLTAGIRHDGDIDIIDIVRGKWDFPELKRLAIITNAKYRGKGLRGIYIEDKASGQSLIQELKRQSGISVIAVKVGSDKVSRLNAVTPLIEGGRVHLPKDAPWLDDFINEAATFPSGKHDDQIDALSIALDALSRMHVGDASILNQPFDVALSLNAQATKFTQLKPALFKGWGE
jgi:predicted phage terminase large subunit-like protein